MQVSQVTNHCTHAVIGGKQSIEFGISNSAEFFNILSSTLYKDQILAVVREVLCNAWDAHIEAGCTDRPVQITLTNDTFVIKDFGKGIHHDDMGLIYGTYGNSTKKNDGNQTGGFGLGCKAPFAYTDHFEVTSCHAGIKTIYSLSKSSAQVMGKPGIIPIASFPTEEAGLTVTIHIKTPDLSRFNELIQRIVFNGDMNMHLNGKQLDTIGFDLNKGNYLITQAKVLDTAHKIVIRYGNVIYPVDTTKGMEDQHTKLRNHLNTLDSRQQRYSIIFQAPPHSISVTPSRESLSMQEHTVNTLKSLFDGFINILDTKFTTICQQSAKELTQKAVADRRIGELLSREEKHPSTSQIDNVQSISDLGTMAKVYLQGNYPSGLDYRKKDIVCRIEMLLQEKLLDRGKAQQFLFALKQVKQTYLQYYSWGSRGEKSSWLQRRIIAPLLTKLSHAGLDTTKLYGCDHADANWKDNSRERVPPLVPATSVRPRHLLATLPYLRNIIVLASRRDDLVNTAYAHEVFKTVGKYQGFLVYIVGRKKGEATAARKFFDKQGMRVVDLTTATETQVTKRSDPTPRKPAKKGLVALSNILNGTGIYTSKSRSESATRIENPEFVIKIAGRNGEYSLDGWTATSSLYLTKLFGAVGGITTTTVMHEKWLDKGSKDFLEYVCERVCSYLIGNPRIKEYWAVRTSEITDDLPDMYSLINLINSNKTLMQEFGIVNNLTEEDEMYLHIWEALQRKYPYNSNPDIKNTQEWFKAIPVAQSIQELVVKLNNPLVNLIDVSWARSIICKPDSDLKNKTVATIISLINS